MPWIVSKYWSAFRRNATAEASGRDESFSATAFLTRPDLGHEERGAALRAQDRAEPQEELPDPFLILDSIAYGRHGIQDEPTDLLVLDHASDGVYESSSGLGVHVLAVDAEVLVHFREIDELQATLLHQALVEEVERDDVLQQLVRGLGDAQVQGVLVRESASD